MKNKELILSILFIILSTIIIYNISNKDYINVENVIKEDINIIETNEVVLEEKEELEEQEEVEEIDSNTNNSIETNNNSNTKSNTKKESNNNSNTSTKTNSNTNPNTESKTDSNTNNSTKTNNDNNTESSTETNDDTKEEVVKTQEDINNDLIKELYNTYGLKVGYGDNAEVLYYGSSKNTKLEDHDKAYNALVELKSCASKFPSGFFDKFKGVTGYRIILYDYIPTGVNAYTSYEFGDDVVICMNVNNYFFSRTMYHETWHAMENLLKVKYGNDIFSEWDSYNYEEFSYGDTSNNNFTVYDTNCSKEDMVFISSYSKTNSKEDRAELFADLMFRTYKRTYMNSGYGINNKAIYLANVTRKIWSNVNKNYWEKYISF